jgi:AcrR family transcriptional regulator
MEPEQRRGPGRSESARLAILTATARQFAERGYDSLTMEGIASEAKVGKQTIYRWWPSRTALVADALAEGLIMPDWFVPADSGDIRADLAEWVQNVVDFISEPGHDGLLRSLVVAAAEDEAVALRLNERLGVLQFLGERMQRAVDAGELTAQPVEDLVEALLGAVVVRVLRRRALDDGFAGRLVSTLLGPARV